MLSGECDSDRSQIFIHIVHSELQFPSLVPLAHFTSVTRVLILLLMEQFRMALVRHRSIFVPMFMEIIITDLGDSTHFPILCTYFCGIL
jgi:hypothetical protein